MIKKITAFSLFVIFALCLLGCSQEPQNSSDTVLLSVPQADAETPVFDNVLFIYMCGSDLETRQGLGGKSIDELLSSDLGERLTVVIETGGAKKWRSHDIRSDKLQRWEISGGELKLIETIDDRSMGDQDTLTDFLLWGCKYYPSEHSSLVLWNHGRGCLGGVCTDENHVNDTLRLDEISGALKSAKLKNKFEIIGFDACLMGSIETAAAVKDYAQFMAASEENEPGGGWDYKAFAEALASQPMRDTGFVICESFMEKSKRNGKGDKATMSVFDLSITDSLISEFDAFTASLNETLDKIGREQITSAVEQSEHFGSGNSNLIDLGNFVSHTNFFAHTKIDKVLTQFIVCTASSDRNIAGVSFCFPVTDKDIENYEHISISEMYIRFLKTYSQT